MDMCTIRDTRTGHYAKVPKDPKMRDQVTMGASQDSLEDKTLTVSYGPDFVNISFFNFCTSKKETAKVCKQTVLSDFVTADLILMTAITYFSKQRL